MGVEFHKLKVGKFYRAGDFVFKVKMRQTTVRECGETFNVVLVGVDVNEEKKIKIKKVSGEEWKKRYEGGCRRAMKVEIEWVLKKWDEGVERIRGSAGGSDK